MRCYRWIMIMMLFYSCASGGIHNDGLNHRHKEMLKQDLKMKRSMQKARSKSTPARKRNKVKKAKKKFI